MKVLVATGKGDEALRFLEEDPRGSHSTMHTVLNALIESGWLGKAPKREFIDTHKETIEDYGYSSGEIRRLMVGFRATLTRAINLGYIEELDE